MKPKVLRKTLIALVAAVAMMFTQAPAEADGASGLSFEGRAALPEFPCPTTADCSGTFDGTISGVLGGKQFVEWQAELFQADLDATFGYTDSSSCLTGTADGTATINAGINEVLGTYSNETFPAPILGLRGEATFHWERFGLGADLQVFDAWVEVKLPLGVLGGGEEWVRVLTDGVGRAEALFAPDIQQQMPECDPLEPGESVPLEAEVEGTASFADPQ